MKIFKVVLPALAAIFMTSFLTSTAFAHIDAYPTVIRFQDTKIGLRSLPQQVTITNRGTDDVLNLRVLAPCDGSFDIQQACTSPLTAGQSCSLSVSFAPVHEGPISCSISISGGLSENTSTDVVVVSGRGANQKEPPIADSVSTGTLPYETDATGFESPGANHEL